MAGAISPWPYQQFFDSNGEPAAGYQLFTYAAGTTTKQNTYSDSALSTANSNPIVLNSAGACTMYWIAGGSYKLVLATPSDTDPPTSPVWTRDNLASVPLSGSSPDVTGPIGDDGDVGDVYYLSDGSGSKTAGTWYLADASNNYSSTTAMAIAMATGPVTSGTSGTLRLIGQVAGLSSLAAGTVYYIDTTPGGMTTSPPTNARAVGVADSTTSIILSQWVAVPVASATVPGIISTGVQTLAGAKTWNGAAVFASTLAAAGVTSSAGVLSSSPTAGVGYATGAGGAIGQITNKATGVTLNKVCGTITMDAAALNAATAVSFVLTNSTIAATDVVLVAIKSGATAGAYDVTVEATAANSCNICLYNRTAGPLSEAVVLNFVVHKSVAA